MYQEGYNLGLIGKKSKNISKHTWPRSPVALLWKISTPFSWKYIKEKQASSWNNNMKTQKSNSQNLLLVSKLTCFSISMTKLKFIIPLILYNFYIHKTKNQKLKTYIGAERTLDFENFRMSKKWKESITNGTIKINKWKKPIFPQYLFHMY